MKNKKITIFMLGLAIFSVFFGAGNILFPPYLGVHVGASYPIAIIGFILTGVGIVAITLILVTLKDGDYIAYYSIAGKKFAVLVAILTFMVVGPIIAIPRTATVTYSISIKPFAIFSSISLWQFVLAYFILVYIFVYNRSSVMDILSKFLTPILVISLILFVVVGIKAPVANFPTIARVDTLSYSLSQGYFTMDALASALIIPLVWEKLRDDFDDIKELKKYTFYSIFFALGTLALVYAGIIYIGAKYSMIDGMTSLRRAQILTKLSVILFGSKGLILMAIIVAFTCLTTTVGLVSMGADLINKVSKGKISYALAGLVISIASFAFATLGLTKIINLSVPILFIMYPITILMTVFGYVENYVSKFSIKFTIYGVAVFTTLNQISIYGFNKQYFGSYFWILVTIILFLLSFVFNKCFENNGPCNV